MPSCIFCGSQRNYSSYFPSTIFNGKQFDYIQCLDCSLLFLNPLPSPDDYDKMYPVSYQGRIDNQLLDNIYQKMPGLRYSYGLQFELLKKFGLNGVILDYGCGSGSFVFNAYEHGFQVEGAEFNPALVEEFNQVDVEIKFSTIDQILTDTSLNGKYGAIRLSNVLEHIDSPKEVMVKLLNKLKPGGLLLIEGPVEDNFNLAYAIRKVYFKLKNMLQPTRKADYMPYHIFFSNAKNQRDFFSHLPLDELYYKITEHAWPFPEWKDAKTPVSKAKSSIAGLSETISSTVDSWGNTFIYVGKINSIVE